MRIKQITNQEFRNFTETFNQKSIYQTVEYSLVMNKQGYTSVLIGLEKDGIIIGASVILIQNNGKFKYAYAPRGFLINYNDFYLMKEFNNLLKPFLNKLGIFAIKIGPMITKKIYDFKENRSYENHNYDLIYDCMRQNGYYHLGYNNYFEALKPRFEAFLDISIDKKDLFNNISKNYKTKIRTALKNGISVVSGNHENLNVLHSFIKDSYDKNLDYLIDCYGYYSKNNLIDYLYTVLDTTTYLRTVQNKLHKYELESNKVNQMIINPNKTKQEKLITKKINLDKALNKYKNELIYATNLLKKYPNGIITSASLVIKHGKEVTILIDGYDKEYKRLNSKHLLIWEVISKYKDLGFTKLNLGGMSNVLVDNTKYQGLDNFKLNFNCKMIEFIGDFELVINKTNYTLYKNFLPIKNLLKK